MKKLVGYTVLFFANLVAAVELGRMVTGWWFKGSNILICVLLSAISWKYFVGSQRSFLWNVMKSAGSAAAIMCALLVVDAVKTEPLPTHSDLSYDSSESSYSDEVDYRDDYEYYDDGYEYYDDGYEYYDDGYEYYDDGYEYYDEYYDDEDIYDWQDSYEETECYWCDGSGYCPDCGGTGRNDLTGVLSLSGCGLCDGDGRCVKCGGTGSIRLY